MNEEKINGGLHKLAEDVKKTGMKFGIWVEPEMISPDSDLYKEHPDWAIQIPGKRLHRAALSMYWICPEMRWWMKSMKRLLTY